MNTKLFFALVGVMLACYSCKEVKAEETTTILAQADNSRPKIERGEYLVNILGCADCHTPKKMGAHGPENDMARYLMGFDSSEGLPPVPENVPMGPWVLFKGDLTAAVGPWGTSFAGNLTPHETGIGTWTLEQFTKALREAKFKGLDKTRPMMPPMPRHYAHLTDSDIDAIFAYLQSLEPIDNVVPGYRPPSS